MKIILTLVAVAIIALAAGGAGGFFYRKNVAEAKIGTAEEKAKNIISQAERNAAARNKDMLLEAKEDIHRMRSEMERESKGRRCCRCACCG